MSRVHNGIVEQEGDLAGGGGGERRGGWGDQRAALPSSSSSSSALCLASCEGRVGHTELSKTGNTDPF